MKPRMSLPVIISLSLMSSTMLAQHLVPGPSTGPLVPGQPGQPGPGQPPPVVAPAKKVLNPQELEMVVRNAAREYLRQVVEVVGEAYQVRFNLREGILGGKVRIGDYDQVNYVRTTSDYQSGRQRGLEDGRVQGYQAGLSAANNRSYSLADSDISAAVDKAIETEKPIQFKPNPRMIEFSGVDSNLSAPETIESALVNDRYNIESQIRGVMYNRVSSELFRALFDLRGVYREHLMSLPDSLRGENAFRSWISNSLSLSDYSSEDARRFYREISNSQIYENAPENERAFVRAFTIHFGKDIESMWLNRVRSMNSGARVLGENIYSDKARRFADGLGVYDGYAQSYRPASIDSFKKEFINYYSKNYERIQYQVQNSSYVTGIKAVVQSEEGKTTFTAGDTFNIVLLQVANRGMKEGSIDVEMPREGLVTPLSSKQTMSIAGLTKLKSAKTFVRMGYISDITAPDQDIAVRAVVNGQSFSTTVKATFEELLKRGATSADPQMVAYVMSKAAQFMKVQYDDLSGFGDQYKNRRPDMLLVRMRALFDQLTEAQKNQLRAQGQIIRDAFGGKPSKFLNPKRNEWDSVQAMINEMGLSGQVPEKATPGPTPDPGYGGGG